MTRSRQTADWGSRAGLAKIVPSSVAVGSGTGSSDALGNVTFSGASSITLRNVFSSTYKNYKVVVNVATTSTDMDLQLRVGNSGTADTTANSQWTYWLRNTAGSNLSYDGANVNYVFLASMETYTNTALTNVALDIYNPFIACETGGNVQISTVNTSGAVTMGAGGFIKGSSTSWADLIILSSTGNFTGTITIYGYTN